MSVRLNPSPLNKVLNATVNSAISLANTALSEGSWLHRRRSVMGIVQRLGGGRGCYKFVPVLGGDGTKIAPPGDLCDQPPSEMS